MNNYRENIRKPRSIKGDCQQIIGIIIVFIILQIILIIPSEAKGFETNQDLDVECVWENNFFIQYNDYGVRISNTDVSPNITITNNLNIPIRIISVAIHMDWQPENENYYSWIFDIGFIGQEVEPGENLNVNDVWIHLDPNHIGNHEYRVIVEYGIDSDQDVRTYYSSERSDFNIELNKLKLIVSFIKGSDVIFSLIPVSMLGFAIYKIQTYQNGKIASEKINVDNKDNKSKKQ